MAEETNIPKSHHVVAQMHLARFNDANGKFWIYNKKGRALFYAGPKAAFAETHFYTVEDSEVSKTSHWSHSYRRWKVK